MQEGVYIHLKTELKKDYIYLLLMQENIHALKKIKKCKQCNIIPCECRRVYAYIYITIVYTGG